MRVTVTSGSPDNWSLGCGLCCRACLSQVVSEAVKPLPADMDSSDTSDTASDSDKAGRGCPLGLDDVLRFPWFSPLGFSLAR